MGGGSGWSAATELSRGARLPSPGKLRVYLPAGSILRVTQERWYALYFLDTSLRVDYGWDHAAVDFGTRIGLGLRLRFLC